MSRALLQRSLGLLCVGGLYAAPALAAPVVAFAPPAPPGLHGVELSLGPASADATVMPVAINKSADNGRSCAYLSTTDWPAHATGIDAVKGLGSDYEFAWIQGESDALSGTSQADYESCLKGLLVKIRSAFGGSTSSSSRRSVAVSTIAIFCCTPARNARISSIEVLSQATFFN